MPNQRSPGYNAQSPYERATGSYPFPTSSMGNQFGSYPQASNSQPRPPSATSRQLWCNSPGVSRQPFVGSSSPINNTPCDNCNYTYQCVRPTGSLGCHRCASLNLACNMIPDAQSSPRPSSSRDWPRVPNQNLTASGRPTGVPLVSESQFGNPPRRQPAFGMLSSADNTKAPRTLEPGGKRLLAKGCISNLDARLSRLENLLEEAIPDASHVLNPKKYSTEPRSSTSTDHRWASYPSQMSLAGGRSRRISQEPPLQLPEDPLLDGAMEDALLAGQPFPARSSHATSSGVPPQQQITTAKLFLESHRR
ncbi:hypothetical protein VP01_1225g7 [Puccinia sorghi]|uniref:Uncharacterized protein n=1 Tax=Puccinia sorghi TaxID=27349 RepID=A0A0L6VPX1_9BASI|nr:hypothetical protein VP01_1225g7 [Puccinia sorghi]